MRNVTNYNWKQTNEELPPVGVAVITKIHDARGWRNVRTLVRRESTKPGAPSLWFSPDGSGYVYYQPTHWAKLHDKNCECLGIGWVLNSERIDSGRRKSLSQTRCVK